MPGKVEPVDGPALGAAGMDPQDRERHRQAAPPLDDAREVGIGEVVVGVAVAAIAVGVGEHVGEHARARLRVGRMRAVGAGDIARQPFEMREGARQVVRRLGECGSAVGASSMASSARSPMAARRRASVSACIRDLLQPPAVNPVAPSEEPRVVAQQHAVGDAADPGGGPHRTPLLLQEYAIEAEARGLQVIIAGAGGAAHLPGMTAAHTVLPVLGVPVQSHALQGLDSLLSIVQMPGGVPVATLAIGKAGAINAALLAVSILGNSRPELRAKLKTFRDEQTSRVLKDTLPHEASS